MHMETTNNTPRLQRDELDYLLRCSRASLASYRLVRHAESANLRKQALELMRAAVEAQARALLANWIEDNGEAIICGSAAELPAAPMPPIS